MAERGYLYNWAAANVICPEGWRLPSDDDWTALTDYVSNAQDEHGNYLYRCDPTEPTYIARELATGANYWYRGYVDDLYPCEPEYDLEANNATGFSAVPAGSWYDDFLSAGFIAYFWSSTEPEGLPDFAWYRSLYYCYEDVKRSNDIKDVGRSVRCLRD